MPRNEDDPKANVFIAVGIARLSQTTGGRANARRVILKRATAQHAFARPLRHVAMHIVETPGIGRVGRDRSSFAFLINRHLINFSQREGQEKVDVVIQRGR